MSRLIPVSARGARHGRLCERHGGAARARSTAPPSLVPGQRGRLRRREHRPRRPAQWHAVGKRAPARAREADEARVGRRISSRRSATRSTSPCSPGTRSSRSPSRATRRSLLRSQRSTTLKTRKVGDWTAIAQTDAVLERARRVGAVARREQALPRRDGADPERRARARIRRAAAKADELLAALPGSSRPRSRRSASLPLRPPRVKRPTAATSAGSSSAGPRRRSPTRTTG